MAPGSVDDFVRFIHHGRGTAAIDREAAVSALDSGRLPSSGGERRMLQLSASLAGHALISLGDAVTGIDQRSTGHLIRAIHRASGTG